MTVVHDRWDLAREFAHSPARVFAAWARPELKVRWFDLSDSGPECWQTEFRVGGHERFSSAAGVRPAVEYVGEYHDIVSERRIVSTYRISIDDRCGVVALSTVEFSATAAGTLLRCSQHAAHLDGLSEPGDQRDGLGRQLVRLGDLLDGSRPADDASLS